MPPRIRRSAAVAAAAAATLLALTACSGNAADQAAAPAASAAAGGVDLKAAGCPATVVVQTDWVPESEHGHLYELLGSGYSVDPAKKSVTGPLVAGGRPTGVNIEIRAGGPAINYSTVGAQMAQDDSITMGYIGTDANIQNSKEFSYTAVFAPLDVSPFMLQWDPATYPAVTDFKSLNAALSKSGGKVRYFGASSPYIDYMVSAGYLSKGNLDGSYDGSPAGFVTAGGKDAQQGFASAEPYIYQNEVAAWKKPVKYELVKDTGWTPYTSAVSVRTGDLTKLDGCLKKLVPVLQQAEVDFVKDPSRTITTILDLTKRYDLGVPYSKGVATYSVKTMKALKLIGNGENSTIGDFDEQRSAAFFTKAVRTFTGLKKAPKPGLKATDIYTNRYIDPSIGL